jgi:hypothetical protein
MPNKKAVGPYVTWPTNPLAPMSHAHQILQVENVLVQSTAHKVKFKVKFGSHLPIVMLPGEDELQGVFPGSPSSWHGVYASEG